MYYFFFLSRHLLCSLTFLVLQWFFCRWDYLRIIPVIYIAIYLCGHRDFLFHTKIPFWGRDFNLGWFFLFWFFIWMRFFYLNEIFYLDEILLSERDFSFWMRFSYLNEIFHLDEIFYLGRDWSASLSLPHKDSIWCEICGGVSGRQTPLPLSGPTMDHPPSTLSSFINLLASRQKVFLILGRSVFFFFPYNISHPFPKVSGLSGSLVMLVLSRSVINDDCIPDRSGAFSQIIPSIPWIIKRMKKIIIKNINHGKQSFPDRSRAFHGNHPC